MPTFISLLRGINVSGQRMISMADLKKLYESLGCQRVRSYLQSGNLVFEASDADPASHARTLEKAIASKFGHDVAVLIKTDRQLGKIVAENPFLGRAGVDPQFLHATFLESRPKGLTLEQIKLPLAGKEAAQQVGDVLFLYCPNGYGRTRINNAFFEKAFSTKATTRNWRTVTALDAMGRSS